MLKKIIIVTILTRIVVLLIIFITYHTIPFNTATYNLRFHYPENNPISITRAYSTWDAQHYLLLSQIGYNIGQQSNRFYPLYPFIIHVLMPIFGGNAVITGLFVSNILFIVAMYYFYLFLNSYFHKNQNLSLRACILLLLFPASFYFSLIYAESLLFLVSVLFFYFLYKKQFLLAGVCTLFLTLSRPTGILIIIPFLYFLASDHASAKKQPFRTMLRFRRKLLYALFPFAGLGIYFCIMYFSTGSFMSGIMAESVYGWHIGNMMHPVVFFRNLFSPIQPYANFTFDEGFFVLFIGFLPLIWKKLDKTLFIYSLTFAVIPLFGSFNSYMRYLLPGFPLYMAGAYLIGNKQYKIVTVTVLSLLALIQCLLIVEQALNQSYSLPPSANILPMAFQS